MPYSREYILFKIHCDGLYKEDDKKSADEDAEEGAEEGVTRHEPDTYFHTLIDMSKKRKSANQGEERIPGWWPGPSFNSLVTSRLERRLRLMPGYNHNMQRTITQYEDSFEYANEEEMLEAAAMYESEMEYESEEKVTMRTKPRILKRVTKKVTFPY
jgi:hypothetical protein